MKRIQAVLDGFVEQCMAVGTSVLIYKDGKEIFFGCSGQMNQQRPEPFGQDTIMKMYSMTKVVTSAATMTLFEKGLLSPETPLHEIIPEYKDMLVRQPDGTLLPAIRPITIENLLTMTSGIGYITPELVGSALFDRIMVEHQGKRLSTLDFARVMAEFPLHFQPGEGWLYSHGASVLGGVIAAVTGMELGDYMKQVLFDPLEMKDTYFRVPEEKRHRIATIYNVSPEGNISLYDFSDSVSGTLDLSMADMGGGGLFSTLDDFARFGEMLRKDGAGVLRPESVREMTRNHLSGKSMEQFWETPQGYGYGWLVRRKLQHNANEAFSESIGSFGWNGKAGTTLRIDPVRGLTVVFGVQRVPSRSPELVGPLMRTLNEIWPIA